MVTTIKYGTGISVRYADKEIKFIRSNDDSQQTIIDLCNKLIEVVYDEAFDAGFKAGEFEAVDCME